MINRPDYIAAIEPFIDKPLVKILAGIRRCGKSTIFEMLREELLRRGIGEDQIICKRYTEMDIPENITAKQMYDELTAAMAGKGHCYLLLDEIQEITGWEKTVNSLLERADADIYVTGSNSKLMSSEISTYLTGRYVSIPVYTLSFKEYLDFKADSTLSRRELLEEYIRFGGFPIIALSEYDEQSAYQIVNGIYHTVVSRDIVKRHRINKQDLFDRVVKYIIENMGKTFSANSISTFLKSEHRKVSVESIYNYLRWLEQAFIIYPCERYDLQGKSILKTQEKYYLADVSLKYALLGYNRKMLDGAMENIVYLEAPRLRCLHRQERYKGDRLCCNAPRRAHLCAGLRPASRSIGPRGGEPDGDPRSLLQICCYPQRDGYRHRGRHPDRSPRGFSTCRTMVIIFRLIR